jgi:hypothetical protein
MRSVLTIVGFGVDDLLLAGNMLINGDATRGSTREIAVDPLHFRMQQISLGFRLTALSEFLDPVEVEILMHTLESHRIDRYQNDG